MKASGRLVPRLDMEWESLPGKMDPFTKVGGIKIKQTDWED